MYMFEVVLTLHLYPECTFPEYTNLKSGIHLSPMDYTEPTCSGILDTPFWSGNLTLFKSGLMHSGNRHCRDCFIWETCILDKDMDL